MHTTGAPFDIAFRIGGLQALSRGLEAVALAHREQTWLVGRAEGEALSGGRAVRLQSRGRGVGLIIGCRNMPTWTGFASLFANVATGNAVVVKPHPRAVLPWAIAVAVLREALGEAGFERDLVSLAAEDATTALAALLARRDEIGLIDFTGGAGFARWLEEHATHARQWRFASATNVVIVDSLDEPDRFFEQLSRSVFEFGGRLCTSPRVLLIPRPGVLLKGQTMDTDAFINRLARLFERGPGGDPVGILGAVLPDEFDAIRTGAVESGEVVVDSLSAVSDNYPGASSCTPALVRPDASAAGAFRREWFGPLLSVIEVADVADAVSWAQAAAREEGMVRAQVWSVDAGIRAIAFDSLTAVGVDVLEAGAAWEAVPMAFRDLHGAGMNSAANTTLGSADFVVGRFFVVRLAGKE
jgi:phenylacetic acid degradation protein paaN